MRAVNGAFTRALSGREPNSMVEPRVLLRKNILFSFQTTLAGDEWPEEVLFFILTPICRWEQGGLQPEMLFRTLPWPWHLHFQATCLSRSKARLSACPVAL